MSEHSFLPVPERVYAIVHNNLHARVHQLGADDQRHQTADHKHGKAEPQVQGTDVLVVGGEQPTLQAMRGVVVIIMMIVMCCYGSH